MKTKNLLLLLAFSGAGFFASAQDPCDSVAITDIRYDAFRDSILLVGVINHSGDIFSYPGFILYDSAGDTIAIETVNFFGIGTEQVHALSLHPGAGAPKEVDDGVLELWTLFYDTLVCTFTFSGPLCPDTVCNKLVFSLENFGGALTIGDFTFEVRDSLGNPMINLGFSLNDTLQGFRDTICLPPGAYSFELSTDDFPTGGQPYFYLYEPWSQYYGSTMGGYFNQASLEIPFLLYENCFGGTSKVREVIPEAGLSLVYASDGIWVAAAGKQIKELMLYDLAGRLIGSRPGPAGELFLPFGQWKGMFVVQIVLDDGERVDRMVLFP